MLDFLPLYDMWEIIICYFFLGLLLLITVLYSKIMWQLKSLLIIASIGFFGSSYQTISEYLGRPSVIEWQQLPKPITYFAHWVDKKNGQHRSGSLFVLGIDEKGYKLLDLPYDQEKEKKMQEAKNAQQQGFQVKLEISEILNGEVRSANDGAISLQIIKPELLKQVPGR